MITCVADKDSFESLVASVDIFSEESRLEFERCTGKRFSRRSVPSEPPTYEYIDQSEPFDETNLGEYYDWMTSNITFYYSG